MMLSEAELDAIRERCEKATEGEWVAMAFQLNGAYAIPQDHALKKWVSYARVFVPAGKYGDGQMQTLEQECWGDDENGGQPYFMYFSVPDAEFIAGARSDVPALLKHIATLELAALTIAQDNELCDVTLDEAAQVVAIHLLAAGTVDEQVAEALRLREDVVSAVVEGLRR